jgi:hypothetical protein
MRRRLYLETMEEVMPRVQKMVIEKDTVSVMPFMPLSTPPTLAPVSAPPEKNADEKAGRP